MTVIPARVLLAIFVALGVFVGVIEIAAYSSGDYPSDQAMALWQFVCVILLASWVEVDSRSYPLIYKPFRFGWLVLFYLPFYLPYYLVRTRGAKGVLWLLALIAVPFLGPLVQLAIWIAD